MGLPGMARPMTAFQGRLRHHRHQVEWPTLLRSEGQGRQANHRGAVMKPASIKPLRCAIYTRVSAELEQFGFVLPVVIDVDSRVIAGWGLAVAAKRLGLTEVPAGTIADLDEARLRMLRLPAYSRNSLSTRTPRCLPSGTICEGSSEVNSASLRLARVKSTFKRRWP